MLRPTRNNVIVTDEMEQQTGAIVVPEFALKKSQLATVVATGPKVKDLIAGDRCLVAVYGGTPLAHEGRKVRLLDDGSVLAKVEAEEQPNSTKPPEQHSTGVFP